MTKPPFKFSARTRVGFSDTDAQGIVYYGRYNPYFDLARVEYLRALGLLHQQRDGDFVMRANDVEYFAPAVFDDEIEVFVRASRLGRTSVTFSFEAVGHPAVMRNAIDCVGWGGSCVMLGVPPLGTEVSFVAAGLYNDKAILGCRYGTSRPRADIPMLADLYLAGRLKLDELVTRTYPLDEIQTVFDDVTAGSLARGVLTF